MSAIGWRTLEWRVSPSDALTARTAGTLLKSARVQPMEFDDE